MPYRTSADCVCLPDLGFTCKNCEERNSPEAVEKELKRQGYGYELSDNDCHIHGKPDGGTVSATEHKAEEFEAAAIELFDAKEKT